MERQGFSQKMNQLYKDNISYAKGRLLINFTIFIIIIVIWLINS